MHDTEHYPGREEALWRAKTKGFLVPGIGQGDARCYEVTLVIENACRSQRRLGLIRYHGKEGSRRRYRIVSFTRPGQWGEDECESCGRRP
jgi:hypothetical protein